jgi:hypothetical protein
MAEYKLLINNFQKWRIMSPNKIVWWTPLLYYILINYDFLSKLFDSGYIRQFLFIVIMIACVRKVRLVAFGRYFKIFLKVKISKKHFGKIFFGNFWKFFFENFSKKKIGLNFLENFFWKIFKKIFEKKNSKISKKNFLEIFFWNFYFQKNLKTSSESYESHLSNARNHNYNERIDRNMCSLEVPCHFLDDDDDKS